MKRLEIPVDENGLDENGEGFDLTANPETIANGLMVNVPVTLIFPDGRRFDTVRAEMTAKGMARLAQILPMTGGAA